MQLLSKDPMKGTSGAVSGLFGAARPRCELGSRCCSSDYRLVAKVIHGTEILEKRFQRCQTRDAQTQEGNAQERPQWKKGEEPQASDRHRAFGGAPQGEESPEEKIFQAQALVAPSDHQRRWFFDSSCAGLTRASIKNIRDPVMDCRVKPGQARQ
jgi:hypothetical protein